MLYHKEIGIPKEVQTQIRASGIVRPKYSQHVYNQAIARSITLPDVIDYTKCSVFEVETKRNGNVTKVAYRYVYPQDNRKDLILVINVANNFVRTIWTNGVDDQHATLDMSKYESVY